MDDETLSEVVSVARAVDAANAVELSPAVVAEALRSVDPWFDGELDFARVTPALALLRRAAGEQRAWALDWGVVDLPTILAERGTALLRRVDREWWCEDAPWCGVVLHALVGPGHSTAPWSPGIEEVVLAWAEPLPEVRRCPECLAMYPATAATCLMMGCGTLLPPEDLNQNPLAHLALWYVLHWGLGPRLPEVARIAWYGVLPEGEGLQLAHDVVKDTALGRKDVSPGERSALLTLLCSGNPLPTVGVRLTALAYFYAATGQFCESVGTLETWVPERWASGYFAAECLALARRAPERLGIWVRDVLGYAKGAGVLGEFVSGAASICFVGTPEEAALARRTLADVLRQDEEVLSDGKVAQVVLMLELEAAP